MAAIFRPSANLAATVTLLGAGSAVRWRHWLVVGMAAHRLHAPRPLAGSSTGAVQSRTSCGGLGDRLPVLPHLGGGVLERRSAADLHLHDLPFSDLDERRHFWRRCGRAWRTTSRSSGTGSPTCRTTFISITAFTSPRASAARAVTGRWTACRSATRQRPSPCSSAWIAIATRARICGRRIRSTTRNGSGPPTRHRPRR